MRCRRGNVTDFTDNQHNIDLINQGRLRHDRPKEIPTNLILNIKLLASTILIGRHLKPSFYSSVSVALGLSRPKNLYLVHQVTHSLPVITPPPPHTG